MKVLLLNGSPNADGCTYTALAEVGAGLAESGIAAEWFQLGKGPVWGCTGCHACSKTSHCVFAQDGANALIDAITAADGLVVGSPVYYAGPNGALCALLDRAFYAATENFAGKPGAAVVSCRRAGSTAALDRLNKYFTISRMPVPSSQYWNMVHGNTPDEVRQDIEGLQIMRMLGREMARLLTALKDTPPAPAEEERVYTNFVR